MTTRNAMNIAIGTAACAAAAFLIASPARADGECYKGYRDTTPAERETMTRVLETAKKALPPAPEGWVITGDDQVSVIRTICQDSEGEPWAYQFSRSYQRVDDQEARNQILKAAAEDMMTDRQSKQSRLDAIMARNEALIPQAIAAAEKGDFERVDAINREMEKNSQEYQAVMSEGGIDERMAAAEETASRDQYMYVAVAVNPRYESPGYEAQAFRVPKTVQSAYRWSATRGSVQEDQALVLLGHWQPREEGGFQAAPRATAPASAAHAISVRVTADQSRLEPTVDAIDFDALTASISK